MTVVIRPAREDDLEAIGDLTARAYHELDTRTLPRSWPDPSPRSAERQRHWVGRTRLLLQSDPEGCWVADLDGRVVGCALSRVRETMWILSSFAVEPSLQGHGVGAQLLAAAMHHGRGCLRGMFASSADPKAVRRYRKAGFSLHPQMLVRGVVDRTELPMLDKLRDGTAGDIDLMDSIDRQTRGAAHGGDHEPLLAQFGLIVADRTTGSGYVYVGEDGGPVLLAATNRRTAADLMWASLARSQPGALVAVHHITAANEWALDVGIAARLEVHQSGYLALRHMKPPAPYLPHGSLL